jgi:hypothetical protein
MLACGDSENAFVLSGGLLAQPLQDKGNVHQVMEFLKWIEDTQFSTWVRTDPSLFAFAGILLVHTIGMGVIVGINAGIDLRILGFAPGIRLAPLEKFLPVLWVGFWVNAITGTILAMQDATTKLTNPDFYVKMVFIACALINLRLIKIRVFRDPLIDQGPLSTNSKVLAFTSLIFLLGTILAGRLMAYVGPVSGLAQ